MMPKLLVLVTVCFSFVVQGQAPVNTFDGTKRAAVVDAVIKSIDAYYVYPDKAGLITSHLKQQLAADKYDKAKDQNDLASMISRDIRSQQNDPHLRIVYDPRLEKDILAFEKTDKKNPLTKEDSIKDVRQNFYFKRAEVLPGNTGYLEITNFATPTTAARKTVQAAMQFVAHTDALIIDLRNNFGGNGQMVSELISYFFPKKTLTGKSFNRIENKWREKFVENRNEITNNLILNIPVYILTSKRTFSGGEWFAYTMQSLKRGQVIGDTSRGGAHLTRSFSMGNGFVAFIPYSRTENVVTKTDWEGKGVIPDIAADESVAQLAAQKQALDHRLKTISDSTEIKKIRWLINYYQSQAAPMKVNVSGYTGAEGRYAEFEIAHKDDELWFRAVHQKGSFNKMIAISPELFQVARDYQVELIKGANGQYNAVKLYWDDGWSEVINRNTQ